QVAFLRGVAIGDAQDLEAVHVDLFVSEHANPGGGDGSKIFAVVAELLVVAGDEIDAVGSGEFIQGLGGASGVDGSAVIQVAGNENSIGLFVADFGDHAAQKVAVANVAQVHIADEGGRASA